MFVCVCALTLFLSFLCLTTEWEKIERVRKRNRQKERERRIEKEKGERDGEIEREGLKGSRFVSTPPTFLTAEVRLSHIL